jgi:hypothetical protein
MNVHILRPRATVLALAAAGALDSAASPVSAAIVTTTGSVVISSAPVSTMLGSWESNSKTRLFSEQVNFTLTSSITVDIAAPGGFGSFDDLSEFVIPAETVIDSYLLHQDAKKKHNNILLRGSVTFDQQIIGVMVSNQTLGDSDEMLGADGTLYPTFALSHRQLDFPAALDLITISEDRKTISFDLQTRRVLDHIRIITTATIPGQGSLALLAVAGLSAGVRRRGRNG